MLGGEVREGGKEKMLTKNLSFSTHNFSKKQTFFNIEI